MTGIVDSLLVQTATLKRRSGNFDSEGRPIYGDPVTIKCRKTLATDLESEGDRENIKPIYRFFVKADANVSIGDRLDDQLVVSLEPIFDLTGTIQHYEIITNRRDA